MLSEARTVVICDTFWGCVHGRCSVSLNGVIPVNANRMANSHHRALAASFSLTLRQHCPTAWPVSLAADLFGVAFRSYPQGVALIPKVKLGGKPAGILAVIAAAIGLAVIPILAVAAMVLLGVAWKDAPRWTRVTLIAGAVLYAAYRVGAKHPAAHHG